jgi:hypothetical protein
MYDSLGQLLMDSNIAGRTWLERVYSNAWRFQVKADFVRNRAINGSSIISANTPLAAYLGQVHVEEDPTRPGIAYRQGLTMGSRGYGGVTRVYIEGERTVFEHPGDGVDGEGVIFNAAGFRQQCENSNMKLLWTRPLEAEQHPSDCMWILVAFTRREISEGEELTIDRNEAAGNNYGFLHEPKDSDLIISMFPRNVRRCDCGSGNNACPYDRVYLQPALTPEQWEQYEAAVTLKRNTDQRAADRRMNDGELAGQASQEHGESNNLELDKIQGTAHELRSTDRKSNSLDNESNEPISQTKGGGSVQQGRSSAYELTEEANTNGRKLCPNDSEPRGFEVGRSGAESSLYRRSSLSPGTEHMGQGETFSEDVGPNIDGCGNRMQALSGQPLGTSDQASEESDHRRARVRNPVGKGGRSFSGHQNHDNGKSESARHAWDTGSNFSFSGNGNAFMFTTGVQSQVSGPMEGVCDVRNSTWGSANPNAVTKIDSLRVGTRAANDGGFGSIHREFPFSNSISPSQLRFSSSAEPKIRIPEFVKGNRFIERNAETSFLPGNKGTFAEDVTFAEPYGGAGAGGDYHINRDSTVLQGKRDQELSSLRFSEGPRHSLQLPFSGLRRFPDQKTEARYQTERPLPPNVSRNDFKDVYDSKDRDYDEEKRRENIRAMHQSRQSRSAMPLLSSPVLQQPEEGRRVSEVGEIAGDGGSENRVSFDRTGSMPFLRDLNAQGWNIYSGASQSLGTHAFSTERAWVRNSGSLIHDTVRPKSRVRNSAGAPTLNQDMLKDGMASFLKVALPRAARLKDSGGLPMTSEDVTRALSDIIKDPEFQRAVGLSNNGDKSSSDQSERIYPTRPSFNLGRGMTSQKKRTREPYPEIDTRGHRNVFKNKIEPRHSEKHHSQNMQYEFTPDTMEEEAGFQRRGQVKRARHQTGKSGGSQSDYLVVEASTDDNPSRTVFETHRKTKNMSASFQGRFRPEPSAPSFEVLQNRNTNRSRGQAFVPQFDVRDGSDEDYGGDPGTGTGEEDARD